MLSLIVFGMAILIVILITPFVQQIGLTFGYVDQPDTRKIHKQAIVRVGGIAIFIGTLLSWLLVAGMLEANGVRSLLLPLLLGSTGFFLTGLLDDLFTLSPFMRLGIQGVLAVGVWSMGIRLDALPLPALAEHLPVWLSLPLTFLWLAGIANAINWLDGMDGLASGTSALIALALARASTTPLAILAAIGLVGGLLGFLRYNMSPARIFMGDGGSYFIGFTLGAIALVGLPHSGTVTAALMPFLILAIPILDMTLVILSRLSDRKSPFFPDQRHLHHRLLHSGIAKPYVIWCIYGLTLLTGMSALLITQTPAGWCLFGLAIALYSLTVPSLRPHLTPSTTNLSVDIGQ